MASVGVWVDIGVSPVFRALRQDLSEWATPIAVRLFSGDDTPTTSWSGGTPTELDNGDYEPYEVDLTHQNTHISPPPPYWSVFGAAFRLGPPEPDNGVVYGWYLGPIDPSSGISFLLAAGRFDPPITIPPAGLTLTIDELRVYLHDCGSQQVIPTAIWLDPFCDTDGTPLTVHRPVVGGSYVATQGTFGVTGGRVIPISDVSGDSANWDVGTGDYTVSYTAGMAWIDGSHYERPRLLFRFAGPGNYWMLFPGLEFGAVDLIRAVGGVETVMLTVSRSFASPAAVVIAAVAQGSQLTLVVNDQVIGSVTDGAHATATAMAMILERVGTGGSCSWHNLQVRS